MAAGDTLCTFHPYNAEFPASNPGTPDTRNIHPVINFDTTTQETIFFTGIMPQSYANGNLTVYLHWAAATATSGTIGWGVTWERILAGTLDIDADSFATEQIVTAATVSGTSGITSITNVVCTNGAAGTDSLAAGDSFRLRIRRNVATDTATGDAQLIGAEVRES